MHRNPERVKPITNKKEIYRYVFVLCTMVTAIFGKIRPLILEKQFPINEKVLKAFESLKNKLVSATLQIIDENVPFVVETDVSENAIYLHQ